jgi:hypothetical protein
MSSFTTAAAALKTRFYLDKNTIPDMTYEESPAYALIPKSEDWGGDNSTFPIMIGQNQTGSATFGTSQALKTTSAGTYNLKKWLLPSSANKKHYTFATIPGDLIRAMEGNANAYFPEVSANVESAIKASARRFSIDLFRDGFGAIGTIAAGGISSATITLTQAEDAKNFEQNMNVIFSSTNSSAVLRGAGGGSAQVLIVDSVDEDAGTVTFTANVSTVTGGGGSVAAGDFVFPNGDRQDSATPSRLRLVGFEGWTPFDRTTLTSTPFFNIDRSKNKTRLGGSFLDGTTKSIRESIQTMVSLLAGRKANPKYAFLSFSKWNELALEFGSNVQYVDLKVGEQGVVGFKSIRVNGPKGSVEVLPDQGCPANRCFVIQPDTWKLLSLGKPIGFLDEDDNRMLRETSSDSYEVRIGGYVELLCMAPGFNGVIGL